MHSDTPYHQHDSGFMTYPRGGWRRWLFRAPLVLWRLGLGDLLGRSLLLITHTGRRSGLPRRTLVEYHVLDSTRYAPVAFGPRAQWYRNISADPLVTVQDAYGTHAMRARRVTDPEELLAIYALIQARNPVMLGGYLRSLGIPNTAQDVLQARDQVYIVAFEPSDAPTPPSLEADLKWVWAIVLILSGLALLRPWRRAAG
ncbi:MAG: nitroreductase family deazaflavin-dependent oxidoreductase [Anaerolineae bacterium]|nr:nitroreductase family deazaflavin-dependent oxidoreductase [Anaerolineae bacterium]